MNRMTLRWNWLVSLILALALTPVAQAQGSAPQKTVKLKRGQTLSLELGAPLNSESANIGDDVPLRLVRPLVADGKIALPTDWSVHGKITKVTRAGICKQGEVRWRLNFVYIPTGARIRVKRVESYATKYAPAGGDPEWVPLGTPLTAIGDGAKFTGALATFIVLSPFTVPLTIGLGIDDWHHRCRTELGKENLTPTGRSYLYAISKSQRVTTSDAQPDTGGTPVSIPKDLHYSEIPFFVR